MTFSPRTDLLKPLQDQLSDFRGKRVFFERLEGNNGDTLITMGSLEQLQQADVVLVRKPEQAEAIVINGGGGMTDTWSFGFNKIRKYSTLYPKIPLLIAPSSFSFTKTDFASLLRERIAPAWIYTREYYSLKLLENVSFSGDVRLGIDHDMALQLKSSSYVENLLSRSTQKHILIVERNDPESSTRTYQPKKTSWKTHIPWSVKRPINHHLLWPLKRIHIYQQMPRIGIHTPFAQAWRKQILEDYPEFQNLPVYAADISSPEFCSFKRFSQLIAEAAVVVTTRLHVGILASMLGKPTYLKSGSYHKIKGIYEYSLADKQNVHLIP